MVRNNGFENMNEFLMTFKECHRAYIKYLTDIDEWQRMDKNQKIEKETFASRLSRLQKQNEKIQPDIKKAVKNRETR